MTRFLVQSDSPPFCLLFLSFCTIFIKINHFSLWWGRLSVISWRWHIPPLRCYPSDINTTTVILILIQCKMTHGPWHDPRYRVSVFFRTSNISDYVNKITTSLPGSFSSLCKWQSMTLSVQRWRLKRWDFQNQRKNYDTRKTQITRTPLMKKIFHGNFYSRLDKRKKIIPECTSLWFVRRLILLLGIWYSDRQFPLLFWYKRLRWPRFFSSGHEREDFSLFLSWVLKFTPNLTVLHPLPLSYP